MLNTVALKGRGFKYIYVLKVEFFKLKSENLEVMIFM